ncbi:MAG: UdgX family uracil-DNA binding protein, partial [Burkholderiaceae bacterium]
DLCRDVVLHRDPRRFDLLYRLFWRLQREPTLRHDPLDEQMRQAQHWARTVHRDLHKMKAFVRFRALVDTPSGPPLHVAWFEPGHHIVEAVAPFFVRRFAAMRWAILTPERCLRWDGSALVCGPGAEREDAPPADAGEALWLTYYQSIFNPARLKLRMMEKEMPRRYWRNLPEAALIGALAAQAAPRTSDMVARGPTAPRSGARVMQQPSRGPATVPAIAVRVVTAPASQRQQAWTAQRDAAAGCRNCPLGALATQTVWGEGPLGAQLMLVGEQPGDQEDLRGQPFVGPAGQLLDRALAQLGWDRSTIYVTNSVKHFKYEPRGKRRMHKTPAQREADACLHWLEAELALVQPKAIIALGATAARQLLGRPVAVMRERGQWFQRADGVSVLVTLHPSALLRADPGDRAIQYQAWIDDLAQASLHVGAGPSV